MKFTFGWLKDHLDTEVGVDEIATRLTMLGLEVESVEDRAKDLAPFTVAEVLEAKPHPNADRLRVCIVNTGKDKVQVVCGAPNARAGMKGVFAPAGTHIPGTGVDLKQATIRGVESNGMLCSEREMGLSDEHAGIIELPADAPVGAKFAQIKGLDDPVIDVALTPNRPDCAAVHGIARDLAAAGLGILKPFRHDAVAGTFKSPIAWKRDLPADAANACPLVVGRYFRNVRNGSSPKWLQDRLVAIGLRPISALVDITNYVTIDLARPLHVFDADKIKGDLVMRLARAGEKIEALDGKTYTLDPTMTVIADDTGVQGIAGVMGGAASGVSETTKNVFLEVALFDPVRTAATGRKLGIISDARYRFERGIDPTSARWGGEVAARLILEICGGEASEPVSAGEMPEWARTVTLRKQRLRNFGGVSMPDGEPGRILAALGFANSDDGEVIKAAVPPWRPDIQGEADLVEEVLRVHGYHLIPAVSLPRQSAVPRPALGPAQRRAADVRRALAARGLVEAVTFSFLPRAQAKLFGGGADALVLVNPISVDLDAMRPSPVPNLIDAVRRNRARGVDSIALFEVGPAHADDTPEGQALVASGVRAGIAAARNWTGPARGVDALDAKADALAALSVAGAAMDGLAITPDAPGWYHPGRSGVIRLGSTAFGQFGEVHPAVLKQMDTDGPLIAFEVFLDRVPLRGRKGTAKPLLKLSPYQPVVRDFAFVVDSTVPAGNVLRAVKNTDKQLIGEVALFDVYEGEGIGAGKKSLAVSVTLRPQDATLTDAAIDAVSKRIVASVAKATGATLRT
jgi:phenylalanyl-tRNA synthetase beta chain